MKVQIISACVSKIDGVLCHSYRRREYIRALCYYHSCIMRHSGIPYDGMVRIIFHTAYSVCCFFVIYQVYLCRSFMATELVSL